MTSLPMDEPSIPELAKRFAEEEREAIILLESGDELFGELAINSTDEMAILRQDTHIGSYEIEVPKSEISKITATDLINRHYSDPVLNDSLRVPHLYESSRNVALEHGFEISEEDYDMDEVLSPLLPIYFDLVDEVATPPAVDDVFTSTLRGESLGIAEVAVEDPDIDSSWIVDDTLSISPEEQVATWGQAEAAVLLATVSRVGSEEAVSEISDRYNISADNTIQRITANTPLEDDLVDDVSIETGAVDTTDDTSDGLDDMVSESIPDSAARKIIPPPKRPPSRHELFYSDKTFYADMIHTTIGTENAELGAQLGLALLSISGGVSKGWGTEESVLDKVYRTIEETHTPYEDFPTVEREDATNLVTVTGHVYFVNRPYPRQPNQEMWPWQDEYPDSLYSKVDDEIWYPAIVSKTHPKDFDFTTIYNEFDPTKHIVAYFKKSGPHQSFKRYETYPYPFFITGTRIENVPELHIDVEYFMNARAAIYLPEPTSKQEAESSGRDDASQRGVLSKLRNKVYFWQNSS